MVGATEARPRSRREHGGMPQAVLDAPSRISSAEPAQLAEVECLRAENERLRAENRRLRSALDAHVSRAGSVGLFGPVEMTAGTCVGPRSPASA